MGVPKASESRVVNAGHPPQHHGQQKFLPTEYEQRSQSANMKHHHEKVVTQTTGWSKVLSRLKILVIRMPFLSTALDCEGICGASGAR